MNGITNSIRLDKVTMQSWEEQGFKDALNDAEFLVEEQLAGIVEEYSNAGEQANPKKVPWGLNGQTERAARHYQKGWIAGMRAVFAEIQ